MSNRLEENTVRDAASSSAQTISERLPQESYQNQYANMLSRLATKEWFTARMSSASLISSAYLKLTTQQQEEHLQLFAQLCQDDTPMVRRVAARYLGNMVENVVEALGRSSLEENGVVTTLLLPLYEELASNEQPVCILHLETAVPSSFSHSYSCTTTQGLRTVANNRELCRLWSGRRKVNK